MHSTPSSPAPSRGLPGGARRREWLALIAVLLLGGSIRAAYLFELVRDPAFSHPAFDAQYHDYWAWGMVSGDWSRPMGLGDPMIPRTPFFRPPAYPYVLAAVYAVAGHSYLAPRLLQFALGLGSTFLVFLFARRSLGGAVGVVAALLTATYWIFVFFEGELLATAMIVFLGLGAMLSLARTVEATTLPRAAASGILLGLCCLARPNFLAFVPVAALWLAIRGRHSSARGRALAAATLVLAAGVTVLPAAVRNYIASGEWILITANAGINFYIGNNPSADGTSPAIPHIEELTGGAGWTCFDYPAVVRGLEKRLGRSLSYAEASSHWAGQGLAFVRDHPGEALGLTLRRATLFWGPAEVGNNKDVHFARSRSRVLRALPIGFPLVLALAVTGAVLLFLDARRSAGPDESAAGKRDLALLMALFVGTYFASFLPFFFAARYRVPVIPFLLVFAAYGLVRCAGWLARRRFARVALAVAGTASVYALATVNWAGYEPRRADWHYALGTAYDQQGRLDMAVREYRQALRLDAGHSLAHNNLGLAMAKLGHTRDALEHLRAALDANPRDPKARFNLGGVLLRLGRFEEAVTEYELGLAVDPLDPYAHVNLGAGLLELGRTEEAIPHFEEARRLRPEEVRAHLNLGRALLRLGRPDAAAESLERAVDMAPRNAAAHFFLGEALEALGDPRAAARYREALALRPGFEQARDRLRSIEGGT